MLHFYRTAGRLTADRQKKKKKKCLERLYKKIVKFLPFQKVWFLSCTHGSERKCTRAKCDRRLKQKWSSFSPLSPGHTYIVHK